MQDRIIEILKDVLDVQEVDINSSQDTLDNWNSLRHLNLISEFEDEFDLEFDPEEIAEMKSVKKIVEIIRAKQG